jgi:hypothetical protein
LPRCIPGGYDRHVPAEAGQVLNEDSALTSLDGLEQITEISGEVRVQSDFGITSVAGLRNVTSVGGSLLLLGTPVLTSVELPSLRSIGGDFVAASSLVTSLAGLDMLTFVGGRLGIGFPNVPEDELTAFLQRLGR